MFYCKHTAPLYISSESQKQTEYKAIEYRARILVQFQVKTTEKMLLRVAKKCPVQAKYKKNHKTFIIFRLH